ncbi:mRNA cap guanine-N7 methyltransferase isoform X2 [Leptopilina heterotoma]|uniref:mRNA cap guanine-N7 methyltransferase isoform X2 n=1 Tax=Leptopilina heterotoma TaxID=63436 RepID=UPI001CA93512|nr:mRNA cap guanine-N7 methyltransferase isoform X2 [Leptopilina heterotoma]
MKHVKNKFRTTGTIAQVIKEEEEEEEEVSQMSSTKDAPENDNDDLSKSPNCRKRKHSEDSEGSKVVKLNEGQTAHNVNVPSDLSIGSSREEKDVAESEKSSEHSNVVAEHYNSLEEKGLSQRNQSRIVYMRNFNNWIKSMIINEFMQKIIQEKRVGDPIKVLDMCCGKGGDLLKWKKANITHLIAADIASVSVEQCQSRYNDLTSNRSRDSGFAPVFRAEFITADCTKVRLREKYKDPSMELDLTSVQFALHYSFESLPQAECMIKNASESLRPGGFFIGTIPDAYELVSRWQKSEGNKFGNEVFSVEFQSEEKEKPPLFGARYNFHLEGVVNCPEFLVHLPTLIKLGEKFGLELVLYERFEEFFERMKNEGKSLLGKMQALETYPPYHEAPLLGQQADDYQHANNYMQDSVGHRKIGTLSQSEWDAISLYAVFAFKKKKTTWTADAKPEYT